MKKSISITTVIMTVLTVLSLTPLSGIGQTNAWQYAGSPGFSPSAVYSPSLAVNPATNGVYIAYVNPVLDKEYQPASVMKYTGSGTGGWEFTGDQYCYGGLVNAVTLAFSTGGQPFLGILESRKNMGMVTVLTSSSSNVWEPVGNTQFSWCDSPVDLDVNPVGAVPYVAFCVRTGKVIQLRVMKYSGNDWVDVDPSNPSPNSPGFGSSNPQIAISPAGVPYIASIERPNKYPQIMVNKFTGSWVSVPGIESISLDASEVSLAIDPVDQNPAVSYVDKYGAIKVFKFDGLSWQPLGVQTTIGSGSNVHLLFSPTTQNPVVAFIEGTSPTRIAVKQFDGSSWTYIGNPIRDGGMNDIGPCLSLAITNSGNPYVAFQDAYFMGRSSVLYFPLTPPEKQLASYTILGSKEVQVGEYNHVNSGAVGLTEAGRAAHFKKYSSVSPGFVKADRIIADKTAYLPNIMEGPAEVVWPDMQYSSGNSANGKIVVPDNTVNLVRIYDNNVDIEIGSNSNVEIRSNVLGKIDIGAGSQVSFNAINLDMTDLRLRKAGASQPTIVTFTKFAQVKVRQTVKVEEYCKIKSYDLIFPMAFFIGEAEGHQGDLTVKAEGTTFQAGAFVPRGQIHVISNASAANPCVMTGQFIAEKVNSGSKYVDWNLSKCFSEGTQQQQQQGGQTAMNAPVSDPKTENGICIYPVPSNGMVNVNISSPVKDYFSIIIYNHEGLSIYEQNGIEVNGSLEKQIDLGSAPQGLYFIMIRNSEKQNIRKILISR